jgi:hypothetical protein
MTTFFIAGVKGQCPGHPALHAGQQPVLASRA